MRRISQVYFSRGMTVTFYIIMIASTHLIDKTIFNTKTGFSNTNLDKSKNMVYT